LGRVIGREKGGSVKGGGLRVVKRGRVKGGGTGVGLKVQKRGGIGKKSEG
jgi:hypothetical protein